MRLYHHRNRSRSVWISPLRTSVFILVLLILPSGWCLPVSAEESVVISLEQALNLGLKNNLQLQSLRENTIQSAAGMGIEEGRFDPELSMSLSSSDSSTPTAIVGSGLTALEQQQIFGSIGMTKRFQSGLSANLALSSQRDNTNDPTAALDPGYRTSLSLKLQQPLLRDFGSHVNTIPLQQSALLNKQTLSDYERQRQLLSYAIETAYIDLAQAQQIADYYRLALSLAEDLVAGNRKKLNYGQIPVNELQQAETAAEARRSELIFAEQNLTISRENLANLLDSELPTFFRVAPLVKPELLKMGLEDLLQKAAERRPDLKVFALEKKRQDLAVELKQDQKKPRLDLLAGADLHGLSGENQSSSVSHFAGDWLDSGSAAVDGDNPGWMVGLNFSYPLGNRVARSALLQAQSQQHQSRLNEERQRHQIASEVRTAWAVMQGGLKRAASAQRNAELAAKTLEQENQRNQVGLSDSFRLLIIQDNLINANIRLAQALGDACRGGATLKQAIGSDDSQI